MLTRELWGKVAFSTVLGKGQHIYTHTHINSRYLLLQVDEAFYFTS